MFRAPPRERLRVGETLDEHEEQALSNSVANLNLSHTQEMGAGATSGDSEAKRSLDLSICNSTSSKSAPSPNHTRTPSSDSRDVSVQGSSPPTTLASPSLRMPALTVELDEKARREVLERMSAPNATHASLSGGFTPEDIAWWLNFKLPQMVHRLRSLDLSGCKLDKLPSCFSVMGRLEEVDLSRNLLDSDSVGDLGNLSTLRVLIIDGLSLPTIPSGLNQLKSLQILSAQQNSLTRVPIWLYLLPKLQRLYIADNPFSASWADLFDEVWRRPPASAQQEMNRSSRASVHSFSSFASSGALAPSDFARERPRSAPVTQNVLTVRAKGWYAEPSGVQRWTTALLARLREFDQEAQPSIHRQGRAEGNVAPSLAHTQLSAQPGSMPARASAAWVKEMTDELIKSEESYIKVLRELSDLYITATRSILPPTDHDLIFGHIQPILAFHKDIFLPTLSAASATAKSHEENEDVDHSTIALKLADALAKALTLHGSSLQMYSLYLDDYDAAQARLAEWLTEPKSKVGLMMRAMKKGRETQIPIAQRKKFRGLLQTCKVEAKHSQHSLQGYLMLPAQRIQKYVSLLQHCIASLSKARLPLCPSLNVALDQISGISRKIDQTGLRREQEEQLSLWANRIEGDSKLVQPGRRLVREGTLTLRRIVRVVDTGTSGEGSTEGSVHSESLAQQVTLILCNDTCLMVKEALSPAGYPYLSLPPEKRPLELVVTLKMKRSFALEETQGLNCQLFGLTYLRISDPKVCLYFSASNAADASSWCECINNAALI